MTAICVKIVKDSNFSELNDILITELQNKKHIRLHYFKTETFYNMYQYVNSSNNVFL